MLYRMTSYKKSQEESSRDIYKAFQAIDVNLDMILRRRHNSRLAETLLTILNELMGVPQIVFHVGSQVEGSTTVEMKSDIDCVFFQDNFQVMLKLGAWHNGKTNLLAFKDETTPPQFYKLCRLQPAPGGRQEYMRDKVDETDVVDEQGRVLVSNMIVDNTLKISFKGIVEGPVVKHGPSRSFSDDFDIVYAFPCNELPPECEGLFTRSSPGHWPKSQTLKYARHLPVFFIPHGHPHSPLNERTLQWRLSTSLTERQLMFDFTEEQLLVYTLLKMLRCEYSKPKFGDNFSTFHIKTAMMFAIEKHPPDIWRIDNIVACASCCIDMLIQCARDNVCPHFTIGGVNLFDGKLSEPDIKKLEEFLTDLKQHINDYICNLKMDSFGKQVTQKVHGEESR